MWCKQATLDVHTRVPFFLRVPWLPAAQPSSPQREPVELVDVYATQHLADLHTNCRETTY